MIKGKVVLAGAGPGDPGLISSRAMECIRQADAIVYDRLVSPRLVALARPDAELVYVGKASNRHTLRQEEINALLVRLAKENKAVLRLKGAIRLCLVAAAKKRWRCVNMAWNLKSFPASPRRLPWRPMLGYR